MTRKFDLLESRPFRLRRREMLSFAGHLGGGTACDRDRLHRSLQPRAPLRRPPQTLANVVDGDRGGELVLSGALEVKLLLRELERRFAQPSVRLRANIA